MLIFDTYFLLLLGRRNPGEKVETEVDLKDK